MDVASANKPYWASVPSNEIAHEILDKKDKYYQYLSLSGRMDLYRRSWAYYYRPRLTGAQLNPTGQQGELTSISVNHYRNLLLHLETMTCQQRAAFEAQATNSDMKSQSQAILAVGLLDYYMRQKKLERNIKQAVKESLQFGEAFCVPGWDPTSGQAYGKTAMGAPAYQGDMLYQNYTPVDMVRDFYLTSPNQEIWWIPRDFRNKYNLAAKFPTLADEILGDSMGVDDFGTSTTLNFLGMDDSDNVPVYRLIHDPCPALPQGRYVEVLENGTVLLDGPLPYKEAHVHRIAPDEETGTIFGFTVGFDLLSMQEGIDILYSTALTNQATFGVQNVLTPKGHDLSVSQLSGGLNQMEYDPKIGKPEALNLTQTPAEVFNFMGMLEKLMETISGVNSVARGNPEASLKSGAALALVQSMAIQFSMNLQQSYAQLIEDLGTSTIQILQDFASVPRVAAIVGKSKRPLMKQFQGSDLDMIQRVTVDMGNPMTKTTAGKVNLAEALADRNMIDNPDQYVQVLTTGVFEPVVSGKQSQLLLIKGENEQLADGIPQRAVITDYHAQHILEHSVVNASPEARANPNSPVMQATLAHIQEHMTLAASPGYQAMAQMLGHKMIPPAAPAPGPGGPGPGEQLDATAPVQQQAAKVGQPNMPSPPAGTDATSANIIHGAQG